MRGTNPCLALPFFMLFLGLGCGDDEVGFELDGGLHADAASEHDAPPSNADAGPDPTLDSICGETDGLFPALFGTIFACYPEFEIILGEFPDAAELHDACLGFLEPFLDDGTVVLGDAANYAACAAYIDEVDCMSANMDGPNPCDGLVVGTVEEGGDCDANDQCEGDSYCDHSGGDDCGVCAPRKPDNANCYVGDECIGRRCSGVDGDLPGMCRSFGEVGDDCIEDDDCGGRVICNPLTSKCQIPRTWEVGDTCDSFEEDCGFPFGDLYCNTALSECVAFLEVGDDCAGIGLCRLLDYETCDNADTGKCIAPTVASEGENCGWLDGLECASGLVCSNPTNEPPQGVCVTPPALGDTCESSGDCGLLMSCVADECQYGEYTGSCPPAS